MAHLSKSNVFALLALMAPLFGGLPVTAFAPVVRTTTKSTTTTHLANAFALEDAGSAINDFYATQPYVAAFLTCGFKASAADFVAQSKANEGEGEKESSISSPPQVTTVSNAVSTRQEQADEDAVDISRNLGFLFYGGLYQGLAQQFFYTGLYPQLFGSSTWQAVVEQVTFDMAVVGPFLCLPMAYIVKAAFTSDKLTWEAVQASLAKYWEDVLLRQLLIKYWALWIPVQTLNFGLIPPHFRVVFVAAVSFFWVMILSSTAASTNVPEQTTTTRTTLGFSTTRPGQQAS